MEAEAQCAFLDSIELTDGTITDDSDIWLLEEEQFIKIFSIKVNMLWNLMLRILNITSN